MKPPLMLLCGALGLSLAQADPLSNSDREALLERLAKLEDEANSRVDARFRTAIAAYQSAMASDELAMELYLKCVEKVDFEDQKKKPGDFRDWKRKEDERLSDTSFRKALRHQLQWLILTLKAASENADRAALAGNARQIVGSIFAEAEKLAGSHQVLRQPVMGSVFAQAYEITHVKVEKWPLSPVQLDQVYEDILLPQYRKPGQLAGLREVWLKRMEQEGAIREFWSGRDDDRGRVGMASGMRPPEFEKFISNELPGLQWQMEMDLFRHGDQAGAAVRMLAHLEKHLGHPSAGKWSSEFRQVLAPRVTEKAP